MLQTIKKRIKNQRGLTLVELLAVVVILGIIAAIAVPNIGKIIDKTEDDAVVAEGIQIINAAKLYVAAEGLETPLDSGELAEYLDNINASETTYSVKVEKTGNKFSYSLSGHSSVNIANTATVAEGVTKYASEDQLITAAK